MVSSAAEPARPRPPVVLFDLDGTLVDSAPGIMAGVRYALEQVGHPPPAEARLRELIGPPLPQIFRLLGVGADPDDPTRGEAELDRALAAYKRIYRATGWQDSRVFDGIPDVLDRCRARGLSLAVATSKAEVVAERVLDHYGLRDRFAVVAGASEDGSRIAKDDVIAWALRGLGVPAVVDGTTDVVMIGDRIHDIEGAHHWGIPCIAVRWGYGTDTERAAADAIADHPTDLPTILDNLERTAS